MPYTYEHPHPAVTADGIVFGYDGAGLKILLIQRDREPFKGQWALPGGYVEIDEGLEEAAHRELEEETGIRNVPLEQLHAFGEPKRDPRERTISVAYFGLVKQADHSVRAADDAKNVAWLPVAELPPLAFDHEKILALALRRLKGRIRDRPIGLGLLPNRFRLSELQRLYETILGQPLDPRSFQEKILRLQIVVETGDKPAGGTGSADRLYRFDEAVYHRLLQAGFNLEL